MRITDRMMTNKMLSNINRSLVLLDKYNTQASSAKKIQKPSDDPIIANRSIRYRTIISDTEQYLQNVKQADSWAKVTETSFNNIQNIISSMRELCVRGATDTNTTDDRIKILTEFKSLLGQLESELNTTYMGRYIFSGFKTNEPPIIKDENGNNILNPEIYGGERTNDGEEENEIIESIAGQNINIPIGSYSTITINSLATDVYDLASFERLHRMDQIYGVLTSDWYQELDEDGKAREEATLRIRENFENMIGIIDIFQKDISSEHTKLGVKLNKIELTETRLSDDKINYETLKSSNEDVDLAEVSMYYNAASVAYSAALKIGMNINQMTLADYL